MKMSEDERQCLSESRGGSAMSFLFLVIARVAISTQFKNFSTKCHRPGGCIPIAVGRYR